MISPATRIAILALMTVALSACATTDSTSKTGAERILLRVGVTPNYPPMIFKQGETMAGVEADLARRLGQQLGRPVQFIDLRWDEQIPTLLAGRTDIIMSGMSITEAREVRISFTDPYFESGLMAAMRVEDASKYNSRESILNSRASVGVVERTTGDVFVQRNLPNARRIAVSRAADGALELRQRVIGLFVHDAPSIIWLVSENEADLVAFRERLNTEFLAWGVRREDVEFLSQVNAALRGWKNDGTLNSVLRRWLSDRKPPG